MPLLIPRQFPTPSGSKIISIDATATSLTVDSAHTGTPTDLSAPTFTVSTTEVPTSTPFNVPSVSPVPGGGGSSTGIPTIIGLIVGIFVVLAAALITFMTIRHKKRRNGRMRARALSSARKSWSRLHEDRREPPAAELQMRATNLAKTPTIASNTNTPTGNDSFLSLNSMGPRVLNHQATLPLGNPTQEQASRLRPTHPYALAVLPDSHSANESYIPNPFTSPPTSPSPSQSPSRTSTRSSLSPAAMSSFAQYSPAYAHAHAHSESMVTASTASEYADEFPVPPNDPFASSADTAAAPVSARVAAKSSAKPAEEKESRSHELKAMQDLISALDNRAQNKKGVAPPSAYNLTIDTSTTHGGSRLSMGDGLVTPGGHSIREEDAVMKYDRDGNLYWTNGPKSAFDDDQENSPLPPAEVFSATLSPGDARGKKGKAIGKSAP